ncbi:MAG TPA: nucleoside recognition domain-containing protein, partial [Planococcus sp. (in: firmicutes)]|nr:nucleoside recognition domain-containing protein [Planococcus sp. (in: firmicutes)]
MSTFKNGLKAGLKTSWTLGKILFPITLIVTMLQFTPVLPFIINLVAPLMSLFGLSGEAAIPLVLGNALNLYAGIAGILSVELTVKEVFILAVMLSFSHNIFIETGVALKVGVKLWVVLVVRFGLAA